MTGTKKRDDRIKSRVAKLLGITDVSMRKEINSMTKTDLEEILTMMLYSEYKDVEALSKLKDAPVVLLAIARSVIKQASKGDTKTIFQMMDRLHGTPKQMTEISGPDGNNLETLFNINFVKPDKKEDSE